MDRIEDEYEEDLFINNNLIEISREEYVEIYGSSYVSVVNIVLDGKAENCRSFKNFIKEEAEYFIENHKKYQNTHLYEGADSYINKTRKIKISADDMSMYVKLRYGELTNGLKNVIFYYLDNDVIMAKTPETIEESDEASRQDSELRTLLS